MATQNKKIVIDSTATTPNKLDILSPYIDDNSTMLSITESVTSDKKTPEKKDKWG